MDEDYRFWAPISTFSSECLNRDFRHPRRSLYTVYRSVSESTRNPRHPEDFFLPHSPCLDVGVGVGSE